MDRFKKAICNNIAFIPDKADDEFGSYVEKGGEAHDAGYDAYMTGLVFATTAKYIEIGDLLADQKDRKATGEPTPLKS